MKRLVAVCMMAGCLLATSTTAFAIPVLWETPTAQQALYHAMGVSSSPVLYTWFQEYNGSSDPINWVNLEIVADDVDKYNPMSTDRTGENDIVRWRLNDTDSWTTFSQKLTQVPFTGAGDTPGAGPADRLSTTVYSDLSWSTLLVGASGFWMQVELEPWWEVEIETSKLSVETEFTPPPPPPPPPPPVIPVPGAILLGSIGAGLVSWLRSRRVL